MMGRACMVITKDPSSKKIDFRLLKWLNVNMSRYEMYYVPESGITRLFAGSVNLPCMD